NANAIFKRSTVVVRTLIAEWRKKRVQQVAMGAVKFNQLGAGSLRSPRSRRKGLNDLRNLGRAQRVRRLVAFRKRESAGSKDGRPSAFSGRNRFASVPGLVGARLPSCMGQLHPGNRALLRDE